MVKIFFAPLWIPVYTFVGYFAHFFMPLGPILGSLYFVLKGRTKNKEHNDQLSVAEKRELNSPSLVKLFRGVVVGTVVAAAFFAPMRGLAFLATKFSGIDFLHELFSKLSLNGIVDAWMGLIGVVFTIPVGFAAWWQGLRMKTQIENIPTSKAHSAALGLAEFKGIVQVIPDNKSRMTQIEDNLEGLPKIPVELQDQGDSMPVLYQRLAERIRRPSKITEIRSRFYLEDESGKILVDPRGVEFWNGKVHYFSPSARSIFLQHRYSDNTKGNWHIKIRQLNPGDEIYLIGSVEALEGAAPAASGVQRLVVRPSSTLKSTNFFSRIIFGQGKQTHRTDIYDVFFLTDMKESKAADVLTKGIGTIWLWVIGIVCLSVPLLVEYWESLFDWRSIVKVISILF